MIPQEKSAAVLRGVEDAFGVSAIEDASRMTKGLSSDLVFRIVVMGKPYLLRIMTRMNEQMDPSRIFTCMRSAADRGLTPAVRYSNADDGVSITDFVDAVPFTTEQARLHLPGVLRMLHSLPPFPKTFNYVTAHNGFMWRLRKAGLLPADEVEEAFTRYEQICAAYPRLDSDMVSCHLDLKPENILFDGQRLWLVDWQAAFVNDRYFDLAVAANFIVTNDDEESTYLERYFGETPGEYQRARFFLMSQILHMFYAAVFLLLGSAGRPPGERGALPSFREFHRRIWEGEVDLAANEMRVDYGMLHWRQFLTGVRQTRFDDAMRIVLERNKSEQEIQLLLPAAPSSTASRP
jgi:hypothetical protein